jgi:hypothetical protein
MPVDKSRYPADWLDVRARILARATPAGEEWPRCEWCGVMDRSVIVRDRRAPRWTRDRWEYASDADALGGAKLTFVILTIAHLGTDYPDGRSGDKHDKMDCRDENLAALCQRCHLFYDLDEHIANRARTMRRRRVEAGQLELALDGAETR